MGIIGLALIFLGGSSNMFVMALNGGYMPAGYFWEYDPLFPTYTPLIGCKLWWLADWIAHTTSPGDIIIMSGFLTIATWVIIQDIRKRRRGW